MTFGAGGWRAMAVFGAYEELAYRTPMMAGAARLISGLSFELQRAPSLRSWLAAPEPVRLPEVRPEGVTAWVDDWFRLRDDAGLFERRTVRNALFELREKEAVFGYPCDVAPAMRALLDDGVDRPHDGADRCHDGAPAVPYDRGTSPYDRVPASYDGGAAPRDRRPTVAFVVLDTLPGDVDAIVDILRPAARQPILWLFLGLETDHDRYGHYGALEELLHRRSPVERHAYLCRASGRVRAGSLRRRMLRAVSRWAGTLPHTAR
ncbi:hypothetical protein [Streptomyces sp. URMC 123]|uniref:hypothetical protein n=1 Tax=Streptomyces sp. URMC 123 TaxID=3423403 RepID=UPI003F1C7A60